MRVDKMKVYYDPSLWAYAKGPIGSPQKVDWKLEYAGNKHIIPYIYHFPKGIVLDIITILDKEKLQEFFDKYEKIEDKLTNSQRRCAEQEHPYQTVQIKDVWINGNKVSDGISSSSSIYVSVIHESKELESYKKAYSSIIDSDDSFGCQRYCIPYPETDSRIKKLLRLLRLDRVRSMKFSTYPTNWFYPLDIQFEMNEDRKEVEFEHPATDMVHKIYLTKGENIEFPLNSEIGSSLYARQLMYEVIPPLAEGDTLQFDNSISYTGQDKDKYYPTSTGSIGIIGGADGPTTIFYSSKGTCLSVPSFEKDDKVLIVIEGINSKRDDSLEFNFNKK